MAWFDRFFLFWFKSILFEAQQLVLQSFIGFIQITNDWPVVSKMAEQLKCWTANPKSSACVGSNAISVY